MSILAAACRRTRNAVQICYVRPGTTNIDRLKHHGVTADVITQHYLFCWEYLWSIIERRRADATCFVLLDLAGLRCVLVCACACICALWVALSCRHRTAHTDTECPQVSISPCTAC